MKRARGDEKEKRVVKKPAKSEMPGDLMQKLDDGAEIRREISFMDFPNEILIRFFETLDFPSRLKLRLNRRLDGHFLRVANNWDSIALTIYPDHCELRVTPSIRRSTHEYHDFDRLEKGLARLAVNTSIRSVTARVIGSLNVQSATLIDTLSNFKTFSTNVYRGSAYHPLPQVTLSTLLNLSQNVQECTITNTCSSLSAQDLCTLRKKMLEDDCKLKFLSMGVEYEMLPAFVEACFGVTAEPVEDEDVLNGHVFRCEDESVEIYWSNWAYYTEYVNHFESDLRTTITRSSIIFNRGFQFGVQPKDLHKVKLNHVYGKRRDTYTWW